MRNARHACRARGAAPLCGAVVDGRVLGCPNLKAGRRHLSKETSESKKKCSPYFFDSGETKPLQGAAWHTRQVPTKPAGQQAHTQRQHTRPAQSLRARVRTQRHTSLAPPRSGNPAPAPCRCRLTGRSAIRTMASLSPSFCSHAHAPTGLAGWRRTREHVFARKGEQRRARSPQHTTRVAEEAGGRGGAGAAAAACAEHLRPPRAAVAWRLCSQPEQSLREPTRAARVALMCCA